MLKIKYKYYFYVFLNKKRVKSQKVVDKPKKTLNFLCPHDLHIKVHKTNKSVLCIHTSMT